MNSILVNKPQFDIEALKPGTAISIYTDSYDLTIKRGVDVNAVVIGITPLELRVVFATSDSYDTGYLSINDVVKKKAKITLLEKVKFEEESK
ncbi:hypothetical protein SM193_08865 [Bacillus velezensis]|uniref:hypothetical protein n=1 Tax=Bacillus velezensis TaxID=492670 RepID=UPI003745AFE3